MSELLSRVAYGAGGVLLVEGGTGAGKTALLRYAGASAAERGFRPVWGGADELDSHAPLAALASLVAAPGNRLGEVASQPGPALSDQLRLTLADRARANPMLLLLDDLHWADAGSLSMLRGLVGHLRSAPVAWILARDSNAGCRAAKRAFEILADAGAARVELTGLPGETVAELVTDVLGAAPDPALSRFVDEAQGNPLLLTELLTGLRDDGDLELRNGRAVLLAARVPERLRLRVNRWLDRLSPSASQLVVVGAVLGCRFDPTDLARMLGGTTAGLLPPLAEAMEAGILCDAGDELAFRHRLVWRAVLDTVPSAMRRALEREAGRVAVSAGPAGVPQDGRWPADDVPGAAPRDQARPGGVDGVVTAIDPVTATGRRVRADAGSGTPVISAEVRCALAFSHVKKWRPAQAADEAAAVLAEPGLPEVLYQQATAARLFGLFWQDTSRAREFAERLLGRRDRPDGGSAWVSALVVLSCLAWQQADLAKALELGRQAVSYSAAGAPNPWRVDAQMALAVKLSSLGEFAESDLLFAAAERDTEILGDLALTAAAAMVRGRTLAQSGRFAEAAESARSGLAAAAEADSALFVPLGWSVLASAALRNGDLPAASQHIERYQAQLADRETPPDSVQYAWVVLQAAEVQHGAKEAVRLLDDDYPDLLTQPTLYLEEPSAAAWLVRVALAVDDRVRAQRVVREVERLAAGHPSVAVLTAAAAHARGLLDADADALQLAVQRHPHPWPRARATEDLGALLAERGGVANRKTAVRLLDTALERYSQVGTAEDVARVRGRLRGLGVYRRRWLIQTPDAVPGWSSLTGTEQRIARLVAQGMTNRQAADQVHLSPHTVNFHLRQIFRKLGIGSRIELARMDGAHSESVSKAAGM